MPVPSSIPDSPKEQAMLEHVVHSASMIVWKTDSDDVCFYINQHNSEGYPFLQGVRISAWARFIHPEDHARVASTFRNAKATQTAYKLEYRILKEDGTLRWMMSSALPRFDTDGQFEGYDGTTVDVSDRYEAVNRLAKSEAAYRLLAESCTDLISHYDANGTLLYVSPSYNRVLGYDADELVGMHVYDLLHPDDRKTVRDERLRQSATDFGGRLIEFRARHRDGHYIWVGSKARVLHDPVTQAHLGIVATGREITTERQYRDELQKREERFRNLTKLSSDWYWETDCNDRFSFVSESVASLFGVPAEEVVGKARTEFAAAPQHHALLRTAEQVAQRQPFRNVVYAACARPGGAIRWISISAEPMYRNGEFTGYRGVGRDISEDVELAGKLARLADENRALIENSLDIMVMIDQDGRLLRANAAIQEILGYAPEELIGRPYTDLMVPKDIASAIATITDLRHTRRTVRDFENRWVRKDGTLVYLSCSISWSQDSNVMYATARDVTERRHIRGELQRSKDELISVLESIGDAFFALDRDWRITYLNQKTADFIGRRQEHLIGKVLWDAVPEVLATEAIEYYKKAMATGEKTFFETYYTPSGSWVEVRAYPHDRGLSVFFHDITTQHEAQAAIQAGKMRLQKIMEMTPAGYLLTDAAGYITEVNQAMCAIVGYDEAELIGSDVMLLLPHCPMDGALRVKNGPTNVHGKEAQIIRKDGSPGYVLVNVNIERDQDGNACSMTAFVTDITERKKSESRMEQLATHDALTGLPNRTLIDLRLHQMLQVAGDNKSVAVMFIDLDQFKAVNDSMGHAPGDLLLQNVAARLQQVMRPEDIVARLGGDEFIAAAYCSKGADSARSIAQKLLEVLAAPFEIEGQEVFVSASIGVSMYPQDGKSNELLFQNADTAMYRAKAAGRNCYRFFEPEMSVAAKARMTIEQSLRRALERQEFELHYQPRIDLNTMAVTGMEALIRWNHPQLGRVPPLHFIPIAEERGFIESIGSWVLEEACRQTRRLIDRFGQPLHVSVNLSARQLKCEDFIGEVGRVLQNSGLPAGLLELELTESALIDDLDVSARMLKDLKKLGVRLSVDDFGTGYSSLSYLRRFPLDILKLDRSFLSKESEGVGSSEFIKAFVDLAHTLKLSVVAEGVEDEETAQLLRASACNEAQGYLFAKPLPLDQFEEYLAARRV